MTRSPRTRFNADDIQSRGPWLQAIWDGSYNTSMLMKATGSAYITVQNVLAVLKEQGLIQDSSKTARPHWVLTDWGQMEYRRFKSGTSEKPGKRPDDKPKSAYGQDQKEALQRLKESEAHVGPIKPPEPEFADPYGCSMCARKGSLCDIHERLVREQEAKGATTTHSLQNAPTPPPVPSGVKATEQQVGQFRIVQIKVGEVVITVKEPLK